MICDISYEDVIEIIIAKTMTFTTMIENASLERLATSSAPGAGDEDFIALDACQTSSDALEAIIPGLRANSAKFTAKYSENDEVFLKLSQLNEKIMEVIEGEANLHLKFNEIWIGDRQRSESRLGYLELQRKESQKVQDNRLRKELSAQAARFEEIRSFHEEEVEKVKDLQKQIADKDILLSNQELETSQEMEKRNTAEEGNLQLRREKRALVKEVQLRRADLKDLKQSLEAIKQNFEKQKVEAEAKHKAKVSAITEKFHHLRKSLSKLVEKGEFFLESVSNATLTVLREKQPLLAEEELHDLSRITLTEVMNSLNIVFNPDKFSHLGEFFPFIQNLIFKFTELTLGYEAQLYW